jgi:hypothetical protein
VNFGKLFDKATSEIKTRANDALSQSIDRATDTLVAGKDSTQSAILKNGLNIFIKNFGEIKDLKMDSKNSKLLFSIYLKGESGDVIIEVGNYKISRDDDDKHYMEIFEISANRYWIDALLKVFTLEKRFPIPPNIVVPLKILM